MSATDELRRLLDERVAKYEIHLLTILDDNAPAYYVLLCNECGVAIVTVSPGEELPELPNCCPNCGRSVIS